MFDESSIRHRQFVEEVRLSIRRALRNQYYRIWEGEESFEDDRTQSSKQRSPYSSSVSVKHDYIIHESIQHSITNEELQKRLQKETFSEVVLQRIDQLKLKDSEVYRAAGIQRQVFSRLRSNKNYTPKKETALALAIVLRLSVESAEYLLSLAGFTFRPNSGRDIIVKICLENHMYDLMAVNNILYEFLFEPL